MPNADSLNRTLFIADNLPILRGIDSESVDLIATDPPFNKGVKAFEGIVTAGTDKKGKKVSYKDTWTWGDVQEEWAEQIQDDHPNLYAVIQTANVVAGEDMGAFLCWLGVRVLEMHRILKPTGSLYLHIDHTAHAYAKAMMDAIFGRENFRNEIVWCYTGPQAARRHYPRKHDIILFYSYPNATFNRDDIRIPSKWNALGGFSRPDVERQNQGKVPEDWWHMTFGPNTPERTGYPTQKPLAVYERIILASSNEGDIVLDPFAGCATTCVAAEIHGREWIAIDINREAENVVKKRLREGAQLPRQGQSWNRAIKTRTTAPRRTDNGAKAAPELVLISPKPSGPKMTARELRERLAIMDGAFCQGCGYEPPHGLLEYLEVDHKKPRSRDGRDDLRNRILLCPPCNGAKGNKLTLAELRLKRIEEKRMINKAWTWEWWEREGKFD